MYIITIQETFLEVVLDVESQRIATEQVWIARRNSANEETQEYYNVIVALKDGGVGFTPKEPLPNPIRLIRKSSHQYTLKIWDDSGEHSYSLIFPCQKLVLGLERLKISTSAISPDNSCLIVGTDSGDILQYDISTEKLMKRTKNAHFADVTKVAVFPSSRVMISVGTDLQTKLWPVTDSTHTPPTRIFKKQKSGITGISLIGRGRNFLTSSLDGSVQLWECSTAQAVCEFRRIDNLNDPATCMAIIDGDPVKREDIVNGNFMFECDNQYMFVGYKLGTIQQYSVAGHFQTKLRFQRPCEVTMLIATGLYLIAGFADGLLRIYDIKSPSKNSFWDLQLNPNFAIEHALVRYKLEVTRKLSLVVSNGPELLLAVEFDGALFLYCQLVGLSEMFKIVLIDSRGSSIVAATETEIVQY